MPGDERKSFLLRIPPDLWIRSLVRYREMGINTLDLRIPWNWHESSDGKFDFDGATNPNRNLRGLLGEIAGMRFKVIARPGPLIGDHWRNAGIPAWLLAYSDYDMDPPDIQRGLPPPDAAQHQIEPKNGHQLIGEPAS